MLQDIAHIYVILHRNHFSKATGSEMTISVQCAPQSNHIAGSLIPCSYLTTSGFESHYLNHRIT